MTAARIHDAVAALVAWQFVAPAASLAAIGLPTLFGRPLSERATTRLVGAGFSTGFLAALVTLAVLATRGFVPEVVHLGTLFEVGHHAASIDLVADGLSVPYVCFTTGLCALVNAFAGTYLHREPGFTRFFILLALFGTGMNLMVLAGSIDVLFAGWEFLGISSALLIGFFHERRNAVDAALRAFTTYRVCDVGLLAAGSWFTRPWARVISDGRSSARGPMRRAWYPPRRRRSWRACSSSRRSARAHRRRSPGGCRGPWRAPRRRVRSSTEPCRFTPAPTCCCATRRCSTRRRRPRW